MHSSLCNYFLHFQLISNFFITNLPIPGNHTNYPSPTTRYEVPPPPSAASRPPRLHTHLPPSPHQFSKHTQQYQLPHHPHHHNNVHSNANRIFLFHNYDYDGGHANTMRAPLGKNTNTNTPTRPEDVGNVIRLMDEALLCSACDNEARRRLWQYRTVLYCCLIEIK